MSGNCSIPVTLKRAVTFLHLVLADPPEVALDHVSRHVVPLYAGARTLSPSRASSARWGEAVMQVKMGVSDSV